MNSRRQNGRDDDDENLQEIIKTSHNSRLEKLKKRNRVSDTFELKTLGDSDSDETTTDWIEKHNKILEKKMHFNENLKESLEEQEKEQEVEVDVSGLLVAHDFNNLKSNTDTILVLEDKPFISNEEDQLLNVELANEEKIEKIKQLSKKRGRYEKFYNDDGTEKGILSQYDEEDELKKTKSFRLGSVNSGNAANNQIKNIDNNNKNNNDKYSNNDNIKISSGGTDNNSLNVPNGNATNNSLNSLFTETNYSIARDFEPLNENSVDFKAPKKKSKKKLRHKRLESNPEDVIVEEESILFSLNPITDKMHRSSKSDFKSSNELKTIQDREERNFNYQKALEIAEEKSKLVFSMKDKNDDQQMGLKYDDDDNDENEIQGEVYNGHLQLDFKINNAVPPIHDKSNNENVNNQQENTKYPNVKEEDTGNKQDIPSCEIRTTIGITENAGYQEKEKEQEMEIDESELGLELNINEKMANVNKNYEYIDSKEENPKDENDNNDEKNIKLSGTKKIRKISSLFTENEEFARSKNHNDKNEHEKILDIEVPVPGARGIAASLKYIQRLYQSGAIKDEEYRTGRVTDKVNILMHNKFDINQTRFGDGSEIDLKKYDKYGNLLTIKEAFREFSAQWSGKHSGKTKQEKKLKKYIENLNKKAGGKVIISRKARI